MKKSILVLGLTILLSNPVVAQGNESVTGIKAEIAINPAKTSERWYQKPKSSIEIYGVIDIGYTYSNTQ